MLGFLDKYNFIKGSECWGVEIIFTSKDNYTLIAIELVSEKEGIIAKRRFTDISFQELAKLNTKNSPIYISIDGRGVIYKKVETSDTTDHQQLLSKVLPNATLKDFYIQTLPTANSESWIAVIRKDLLKSILLQVEKAKLFAIKVYLGPFTITNSNLLIEKDTLCTISNELTFINNQIISIDSLGDVSAGNEYEIEGEIINSHELIAFSTALSHFIHNRNLQPISVKELAQLNQEYLHKKKCSVVSLSLASLFLIITIVNLLIQNKIEKTYNEYQYQSLSKRENRNELKFLKSELATKEQFIQNSGVAKASRITYYADQIALSVPISIRLKEMFINPSDKKINKAEDIHFKYDKAKISGSTNKSIELNNWIKKLKLFKWVNDVKIIMFNQENLNTPGEFEILIEIKS